MFTKCANDELAPVAGGRRPEAIAAEFSFAHIGVPLFTPHVYCSHPSAAPRHCVLKVLASYRRRTPLRPGGRFSYVYMFCYGRVDEQRPCECLHPPPLPHFIACQDHRNPNSSNTQKLEVSQQTVRKYVMHSCMRSAQECLF